MRIESRHFKIYTGNYIDGWVMFMKFISNHMNIEFNIIPKNYNKFYKKVSKSEISLQIYNLSIFQLIIEDKNKSPRMV